MDEVVRGIGTPILGLALFALWGLYRAGRWLLDRAPEDAASITCRECHGEGALSEEGCVDCMATGLDMPDEEWQQRHDAWLKGVTDD